MPNYDSSLGPDATTTLNLDSSYWFLSDPTDNLCVQCPIEGQPKVTRAVNGGSIRVLGRSNDVVITDAVGGLRFEFTVLHTTLADWRNLDTLLNRQVPLYFRSTTYGTRKTRFVQNSEGEPTSVGVNRALYRTQVTLVEID